MKYDITQLKSQRLGYDISTQDTHADITRLQHKPFPGERQDDHPNAVGLAVHKTYYINNINNTLNISDII